MARRLEKFEKLPVYQKSQELFDLADVIAESLKEDSMKEHLAIQMCSNAALIQAKIAGAEGGSLYSLRMQNAVLIKLAVQDMFNAVSFASMVKRPLTSEVVLVAVPVIKMRASCKGLFCGEAVILPVILLVPALSCAWLPSVISSRQEKLHSSNVRKRIVLVEFMCYYLS